MTLSTLQNRFQFAGNGVTTVFAFNAKFMDDTDLVVVEIDDTTKAEVVKTLTTHYTVSGGNNATGSVTMLTAPAVGKTLLIYRNPALTQALDLVGNDRLPVEEVEKELDKITQILQRLAELSSRSFHAREGFIGTFDFKLPVGIDDPVNKGRPLIINETADGLDFGDTDLGPQSHAIVTANTVLDAAIRDYFCDCSGGALSLTLPLAADNEGIVFWVKHKTFGSSNDIMVVCSGADTVEGGASDTIKAGESRRYLSDGTNWFID